MSFNPTVATPRFDKIADTQRVFRVMLDAMGRPGKVYHLPPVGALFSSTSGKFDQFETMGALLATLLDHEVTFCLLGKDDTTLDLTPMLSAITGSRSVHRDKASYVVTLEAPEASLLPQLNPGNLLYPDTASTLICRVKDLDNHPLAIENGALIELSGPGIASQQKFWVAGTKATFFNTLNEINAAYPMGLDIIWVTPQGKLAGMPRSVRVKILEDQTK